MLPIIAGLLILHKNERIERLVWLLTNKIQRILSLCVVMIEVI